ncbi:glucose 1-dehydrogenase [Brooklawnia cerclae]|uniref:NAD(P)-dependent dehydrogenase (Short-subunit alcohol dehydrogenase family) n=1 Tax=Brooklawnia cerclae TaxID=349934 RepID=A0ABX0SH08_9ACTN|nr:SDR family oxidoreductase [Brooklawnia cerclae]NIH55886.1 NAD(P)-dependent dehydrogenase (short-subunit alcohol dehydrogenase family) [Brooklawnia cerclae]
MFDFSGLVAVITGASSGLGVQFARALAAQGANLVLLARRVPKLQAVADEVRDMFGVEVLPVGCDVTNLDQVRAAVDAVDARFGRADILVNNAGTGGVAPALDMTDEQWDADIALDLTATFRVTREFMNRLIKRSDCGRVINISSMYGLVGNTTIPTSAYHAAKGGVVNLTRALAAEWAKDSVTVNCICPGYFETELTAEALKTPEFQEYVKQWVPLGRQGKAGELNTALLFLASPESSYVTGTSVVVDGGYTCV